MARMLPPYISDEVKSSGEKQIFGLFNNDPDTHDWVVLHSLGLSKHVKRLYGEIDFLVLAPGLGIFCLEVKSGGVTRKEGVWRFTNRFGESNIKPYGPFEQAHDAMFSLKEAIKERFGADDPLCKLLFGYGVMFPHILYQAEGTEQDWWKIYDRDSRRNPISNYIQQLAKYERKKVEHCKWFDKVKSLPNKADINKLVSFLRGDFERFVSPVQHFRDIEEEINRYTEEQYRCLDELHYNPRCLFQGAAGTGKTMLALESVRRGIFKNKRTLLVCFNTRLGHWLQNQVVTAGSNAELTVSSFHRFLMNLASDRQKDLLTDGGSDDFFTSDLPLLALDAIDSGIIEPFDKIVIDEGQDLIREEYLDVLDGLLKGGLAGGNWEMYCDFEKQAIYADLSPEQLLKTLEPRANFIRFKLTINCRNTKPIGEETSLLCGFETPPFLPSKIGGIPVDYSFYDNQKREVQRLERILTQLNEKGISAPEITILSPVVFEHSCVAQIDRQKFQIRSIPENISSSKKNSHSVNFCTIHGFKGLESPYVILTDIVKMNDDEFRSLLYVGMSRAKIGLSVLIHKQSEKYYNTLIQRRIVAK